MPLEKGGRADKKGDQYETNCIIYEILKVLNEINYSVVVEALGTDEIGTDILITTFEGIKEHQQCKARNASKISWGISDLKAKDILSAWKIQLNRNDDRKVALVSPMECSFLVDLNDRAHNTSGKAEDFYNIQILESSKEFRKFYESFCKEMGVDIKKNEDVLKSIDYLQRIYYKRMSEYELQELINQSIQFLFKMLLSIPSNIYIWQHLEKEQSYSDCLTTSHLIENWFQQICRKSIAAGLHEKSVIEFYIQHGNFEKIISNVETLNEEQIKSVLEMAIPYMVSDEYRELAKTIILSCINSNIDLEFPVIQIFDKEYIKLEDDRTFLHEVMSSKISKRIVWLFVHYLEENALSIVDYTDIIIKLCENILQMEMDELWGIEEELSKLIISLYDETANSEKGTNKLIAEKCLDLWDIMFERQLGSVREISMKLMER